MKGYNGGVFVYGQTGSGKTYTMQGDLSSDGFQDRGLVPRILEEIFMVRSLYQ
jgi:kinesin family member 5